ncbi:stage II sporulation protein M [Myxacorys almedinensis]|uniref:Stage II sporulation protein M n=1 Tax=Myxacorys almedinensis A TaxID=2690445 RepID=A0A8J7Z3V2_9CYAN|nr:stage II sporulation protein M [Myxacorys almedinensis]NDJ18820.1 stage II sporulation protein M [Myxacorys almedinensis A]
MNIKRWIARREVDWKQLDSLLGRVEQRGLRSLSTDEIKQLASLYRSVSGDLARARTYQALVGTTIVQHLQRLTSRGYSQVYQGARRQEWQRILEFYRWGFPAVVQQTSGYSLLALALFVAGGLVGWWLSWRDPVFLSLVLPESMIQTVREEQTLWMGSILGVEPLASSQIMVNNIRVSFTAIAGGITLGIGTILLLFFNGLMIGTVGTLVGQNDLAYPFWAFVLPHGSLELPAIFLAGGAGLLIARGILFPGTMRRADALKVYGVQAAQLGFGIVPMLVIAGAIEGFFSPSPVIPDPVKYLVGLVLFCGLLAYCNSSRQPQADIRSH